MQKAAGYGRNSVCFGQNLQDVDGKCQCIRGTIISFVVTATGEATTKGNKEAEDMKNHDN